LHAQLHLPPEIRPADPGILAFGRGAGPRVLEGTRLDWGQFVVQWLHVLAAITWFGAVIYTDFILIPAITTLPAREQRTAGTAIGNQSARVIMGAAAAVIVLGFLRGTVWGRIHSFEALTTPYGLAWLLALVLAVVTYFWGLKVIIGALERFNAFDLDQAVLPDGRQNPVMLGLIADIKRKSQIELLFFLVIFTCMIFMRFN
jgi:uncharacterized membrane protein